MKTAVSIPDAVFDEAERFRDREGWSRSELYATAVRKFLKEERDRELTEKVNQHIAEHGDLADPAVTAQATEILRRQEWEE